MCIIPLGDFMNKYKFFSRNLAVLVMLGVLGGVSAPAFSQSTTPDGKNTAPDRARRPAPAAPVGRFDKMATRLQITPAQQSVWMQYRNSIEKQVKTAPPAPPAGDSDAVTMLRWRADRAADQARKLAAIADATDVLQRSLDGEQRKILNEIVREEQRAGMEPPRTELRKAEGSADSKRGKQ
jgi:hypothetical protein